MVTNLMGVSAPSPYVSPYVAATPLTPRPVAEAEWFRVECRRPDERDRPAAFAMQASCDRLLVVPAGDSPVGHPHRTIGHVLETGGDSPVRASQVPLVPEPLPERVAFQQLEVCVCYVEDCGRFDACVWHRTQTNHSATRCQAFSPQTVKGLQACGQIVTMPVGFRL